MKAYKVDYLRIYLKPNRLSIDIFVMCYTKFVE